MKDYKANVISFQLTRELLEKSTETEFNIPIKAAMREKLEAISQAEDTNPICLGVLAIAHLINRKWNWKENKPKLERS